MSELFTLHNTNGWTHFYPLTHWAVQEYFANSPSSLTQLYSMANTFGSPPEYTIVAIKEEIDYIQVGPLLQTKWHQGVPFNNLTPGGTNTPAGCVAIAMGQIMKYHQHPAYFSWTNMPNTAPYDLNYQASYSTPALIRDIGIAVRMTYSTSGSGASTANAETAFRTTYGYRNVQRKNHNMTDVRNELRSRFPVFMSGTDTSAGVGHAWVCDGVKDPINNLTLCFVEFQSYHAPSNSYVYSTNGYTSISDPIKISISTYPILFHMNWGWNAAYTTGWFVSNNIYINQSGWIRNYTGNRTNIYARL